MQADEITFYDKDALLYRLHEGLERSDKEVVFVVGAPLTAPLGGERGVADVAGVVELIRSEFADRSVQLEKFDAALRNSANCYQAAFDFLTGRAGQDAANGIIRRAVARALVVRADADWDETINRLSEQELKELDAHHDSWHLSPGVSALGALISRFPDRFGKIVLTSNFDPLIEASVKRSGGTAWRTSLPTDGSIFQSEAAGCHVIHIHGFWHGTDTLHTNRQLITSRPTLRNDLLKLLHNKLVVVVAYGGWPDIFTGALSGVVSNDNLFPEVLWTMYGENPTISEHIYTTLQPGIDRNRVTFYKDVDCHELFSDLLNLWDQKALSTVGSSFDTLSEDLHTKLPDRGKLFRLAPLECDRPPSIDVWVGRENELRALEASNAKVVIINGIGGEGKSVLVAHYISTQDERDDHYKLWDWRDCKEQSDRIRTQIIEIIVRFSGSEISAGELSDAEDRELVEILIDQVKTSGAVLVFDNVDSHVDLENRTFTGLIDLLVQRFATADVNSRLILTCRPDVQYRVSSVITLSLEGLSATEAIELFAQRAPGNGISEIDIQEAHAATKGHAFWLDLLAVQATKVPGTTLRGLLDDMRRGREDVPDVLSSIWDKLARREQMLLRFMAEAVRPETEDTIQKFAASQLNHKNFSRALRSLISLNLIVVKPERDAPDLYDLHPLVRQFVRTRFERSERASFIRVVINQYNKIIGAIESMLGIHLPFAMLERWSQKVELEVSAGLYEEAFETLNKVEDALIGGGHIQEYVRVGRLLFEAIDWEIAPTRYKRFDQVAAVMIGAFDQLGDHDSADSFLARYQDTIPQKTARYIQLCDIKSHSYWQRGEFDLAIEWGMKGDNLKKETNVDTDFDAAHSLALARRDAGYPEIAIRYFCKGFDLEDIVAGAPNVPPDGPMFGNVGRCLQFMGRLDDALACYKRSMIALELASNSMTKSNRAYARHWVGQILGIQGDSEKASAFFIDAIRILGASAPVRVRQLCAEFDKVRGNNALVPSEHKASQIVEAWLRS